MKKIVNGKMYNTETADLIADYSYCRIYDFNYVKEELYRKKNGEFFLAGEGGANSKYSMKLGTTTRGPGERIIPMTDDDAKNWLEEYADADIYIELFGEPEE